MKIVNLPITDEAVAQLKCGERVLINGTVYTARDCAHKRLFSLIEKGESLPFDLNGQAIYYAGPCPAPEGRACGSCGPTTSIRMNAYAPALFERGLAAAIGKGELGAQTVDAVKKYKRVYFAAIGGAGALYSDCIISSELIAFPDLLSEAIYRFTVKSFPAVVAVDASGNSVYDKKQ